MKPFRLAALALCYLGAPAAHAGSHCAEKADIAARAAVLKAEGQSADEAAATITAEQQGADPEVTGPIKAIVTFGFMAGMSPEKTRAYYLGQCEKG